MAMNPQHTQVQAEEGRRARAESRPATDPSDRPWHCGQWSDEWHTCHLSETEVPTKQETCKAGSLEWPQTPDLWEEAERVEFVNPAKTEANRRHDCFQQIH